MTVTATPARDLTRLDAMVTWLEANPAVHNQRMWAGSYDDASAVTIPGDGEICGTACCLAGWTLLHDHEHFRFDVTRGLIVDLREPEEWLSSDNLTSLAGDRLNLTYDEAATLFDAANTLKVLRRMTTDLQAGVDITAQDYNPVAVTA